MTGERYRAIEPPAASQVRAPRRELLCLLPAFCGFVAYALYPAVVRQSGVLAWTDSLDARPVIEQGDVILLIAGIVASAVWWFYTEHPEA
ncbi:MAG TPA: hypothetical protein VMB81_08960 [Candidatus Sulfotelmatobacter sp.]|nr:hypothetical protein [Candidatus Sulfotelmatobacter sp.]